MTTVVSRAPAILRAAFSSRVPRDARYIVSVSVVLAVEEWHFETATGASLTTGLFGALIAFIISNAILALPLLLDALMREGAEGNGGHQTWVLPIIVLGVVGVARPVADELIQTSLGFGWNFVASLLQSIIFTYVVGLLIGAAIHWYWRYKESVTRLIVKTHEAQSSQEQNARLIETNLAAMDSFLHEVAEKSLHAGQNELNQIMNSIQISRTDVLTCAKHFRRYSQVAHDAAHRIRTENAEVQQVVRSKNSGAGSAPIGQTSWTARVWRAAQRALISNPFSPLLVTALSLMLSAGTMVRITTSFLSLCLSGLFLYLVLGIAHVTLGRWIPRYLFGIRVTVIFCVAVLAGFAACIPGWWLSNQLLTPVSIQLTVLTITEVVVLVFGVACVKGFAREASRNLKQWNAQLAMQKWDCDRTASQLERIVVKCERLLHSDVQGRLSLTSFALSDVAGPDAEAFNPQHAREVTETCVVGLQESVESLDTILTPDVNAVDISITTACATIKDMWKPVANVSFTGFNKCSENENFEYTNAVIEICKELVVNAVRHGGSRTVQIEFEANGMIVAIDDGSPPLPANQRSGLARKRVIAAGGSWSLSGSSMGGTKAVVAFKR